MRKALFGPTAALAFVWFTTHFGGGFASGRQLVEFYTRFGWYAACLPIIAMAICAITFYYGLSLIHICSARRFISMGILIPLSISWSAQLVKASRPNTILTIFATNITRFSALRRKGTVANRLRGFLRRPSNPAFATVQFIRRRDHWLVLSME